MEMYVEIQGLLGRRDRKRRSRMGILHAANRITNFYG